MKLRVTVVDAKPLLFLAWLAVMPQVTEAISEAVVPETADGWCIRR